MSKPNHDVLFRESSHFDSFRAILLCIIYGRHFLQFCCSFELSLSKQLVYRLEKNSHDNSLDFLKGVVPCLLKLLGHICEAVKPVFETVGTG